MSTATPNFDISNLIGLSFQPLREVIEFLLSQLRDQNTALLELQEKMQEAPEKDAMDEKFQEIANHAENYQERFKQIDANTAAIGEHNDRLANIEEKLRGLEQRIDLQDTNIKNWDTRIQTIENNLVKTNELAERNHFRLNQQESRLDKTQGRGEESAATLQIIEINLNKLEPRTGTIEKRLQSVEQDLSTKVKPRFNVVDAKILQLQKKLKESSSEAQQTAAPTEVAETALSGADVEQLRLDFQDMLENLRGELSEKIQDRPPGDTFSPSTLDQEQLRKLVEQLKNEMDEQIGAMNKNFNLFKEKVALKDQIFDVLSKLKKLEERMTEAEKETQEVKAQQKENTEMIHENEERSKLNQEAIQELRGLIRNLDKKLNEKADESDLDQLRSFVNVLSVQQAKGAPSAPNTGTPSSAAPGKEVAAAAPPMMLPQPSSKDSKKIKELIDKISDVEERVGRNTQDLQKLKDVKEKQKHLANLIDKKADLEVLKKLQSELGKIGVRVDASNTTIGENKKEIGGLKKIIEAMPSFDRIQKQQFEQGKKINENESRIGQLFKQLESVFKQLRELEIKSTKALLAAQKMDTPRIGQRTDSIQKAAPMSTFGGESQVKVEVDSEEMKKLKEKIEGLEKELKGLKNGIGVKLEEIDVSLNNKLDRDLIDDIEKRLFNKLQELIDSLLKRFADKGETKKALKHLEKEIKNLANFFFSFHNPEGDQSLLAKKPLGGWSCATCEKGLINMQGLPVDFHAWNKMPSRDPADRIARVGQGFSKMLNMFRPEAMQSPQHARNPQHQFQSPRTPHYPGNYNPPSTAGPHVSTSLQHDQSPPRARQHGGPHSFFRGNRSIDTQDVSAGPIYMPRNPVKLENVGHNISVQQSSTQATNEITGGASVSGGAAGPHTSSLPKIK